MSVQIPASIKACEFFESDIIQFLTNSKPVRDLCIDAFAISLFAMSQATKHQSSVETSAGRVQGTNISVSRTLNRSFL